MAAPAAAAAAGRAAATRTAAGGAGRAAAGSSGGRAAARSTAKDPATTAATKGDQAALKAQAAQGDAMLQSAFDAGVDGTPFDDSLFGDDPMAREAYAEGQSEARRRRREERGDRAKKATAKPRKAVGSAVQDASGFLLGMFLYALGLNYLKGGAPRVRGWLGAKFLNKPWSGR